MFSPFNRAVPRERPQNRPRPGSGEPGTDTEECLPGGSPRRFHLSLGPILTTWAKKRNYSKDEPLSLILFQQPPAENTAAACEQTDRINMALEEALRENVGTVFPEIDLRLIERLEMGGLILIFHRSDQNLTTLYRQTTWLSSLINDHLEQELFDFDSQKHNFSVGYALTAGIGSDQLYVGYKEAERLAGGLQDFDQMGLVNEFRSILGGSAVTPVYQPITDLRSGRIFGWEALSRGPESSYFHSPTALFDMADSLGSMFALEKVCRERAVAEFGCPEPGQKLFLNINPKTLADPNFSPGQTRRMLDRCGLAPRDVVFEITERQAIRDFSLFTKTLEHYRDQGYQVAIDDVGAGYSGLKRIARLRPDLIKVDMSLVQGIDTDPVQRALVETLVTFADKIGCGIIAEGIEFETELSCLRAMGVHFGQGFYLARPANPRPELAISLPPLVEIKPGSIADLKVSIPVRELVENAVTVGPEATGGEVRTLIESGEPIGGVVVVEGRRPVGLIMSHNLDRHLGTQYGVSLYYQRPIANLMDTSPLIVDGRTPVEVVAEKAAGREKFKLYDHIIVTHRGRLTGIVSVQRMLDTLAKVQVEMARGANPLSGLPGNVAIETEIGRRAAAGEPTSLIYADLDNFKVFNDAYGFDQGDRMILLLSRILTWASGRHGSVADHVGHVGGDDFVILTTPEQAERISVAVTRTFERLAPTLYSETDRDRGYIKGVGRDGTPASFPLSSVSLAIVDCWGSGELGNVAQRAAEMKKYAKTIEGNCFVRDRRSKKPDEEEAAG